MRIRRKCSNKFKQETRSAKKNTKKKNATSGSDTQKKDDTRMTCKWASDVRRALGSTRASHNEGMESWPLQVHWFNGCGGVVALLLGNLPCSSLVETCIWYVPSPCFVTRLPPRTPSGVQLDLFEPRPRHKDRIVRAGCPGDSLGEFGAWSSNEGYRNRSFWCNLDVWPPCHDGGDADGDHHDDNDDDEDDDEEDDEDEEGGGWGWGWRRW